MNIDLPSSTGVRSMIPCSLTSSANRASSKRPSSRWLSSRPRKRTVTLIRSPSSRNSTARWSFVRKSPVPIFGESRTSLKVTDRCRRLASFSRFVSSYLYCPKSRKRTTGGDAIGATSTRSYPRSCAISRASGVGMTPSCAPSSSTTRTCGIRIIWLTRRSRLMVHPLRCLIRTTGMGEHATPLWPRRQDSTPVPSPTTDGPGRAPWKRATTTPMPSAPGAAIVPTSAHSPGRRLGCKPIGEGLPSLGGLLLPGPRPGRRGARFDLPIAEHEHVWDLLLLGRPDLVLHPIRRPVDLDPQVPRPQYVGQLRGRLEMPIGDGDDNRLDRCEPQRKGPREVLDEDADEPFDRAVDGAVDRDRSLRLPFLVDVGEVEPLGQHRQVDLDRRHLPFASECIVDVDVDLRRVEGAVLGLDDIVRTSPIERLLDQAFGTFPQGRIADRLVRLGREGEARLQTHPRIGLADLREE